MSGVRVNELTHEWIEVGNRRWCLACGSYQVRRNGRWRDEMVGPWPGYQKTDLTKHEPEVTARVCE